MFFTEISNMFHNAPHNSLHNSPDNSHHDSLDKSLKQYRCSEILICFTTRLTSHENSTCVTKFIFCIYNISNVTSQFTSQCTWQRIKINVTADLTTQFFNTCVMKYWDLHLCHESFHRKTNLMNSPHNSLKQHKCITSELINGAHL